MKRIEFETYEDFISEVADKMDAIREIDEYGDVSIIAKYNEANVIIKELLCMGYDIASIHLEKEDFRGYLDEYTISIANSNGNTEVWCQPFKTDEGYLYDESFLIYVMDNCSSACIPHCKGKVVVEVGIGDEECDCCECTCKDTDNSETTYISKDKDGTLMGFSKSWSTVKDGVNCYSSYSHYSSDVDMLRSIASAFGVKL